MLYTLVKFAGWGALLAVIGICIGWALRALKGRGDVARALASSVDDDDDVGQMRHRLANLEEVVAERDRLRIQLADIRHADSPGIVGADVPGSVPVDDMSTGVSTDAESAGDDPDEASIGNHDEPLEPDHTEASFEAADSAPASLDLDLDLDAASSVLGKSIELDDLTVIEGIGPKISELCNGIGVTTWRQLADTDIAELQSMLDDAGSRYAVHKPETWSRQAGLLATGQWTEFQTLTDELRTGK